MFRGVSVQLFAHGTSNEVDCGAVYSLPTCVNGPFGTMKQHIRIKKMTARKTKKRIRDETSQTPEYARDPFQERSDGSPSLHLFPACFDYLKRANCSSRNGRQTSPGRRSTPAAISVRFPEQRATAETRIQHPLRPLPSALTQLAECRRLPFMFFFRSVLRKQTSLRGSRDATPVSADSDVRGQR